MEIAYRGFILTASPIKAAYVDRWSLRLILRPPTGITEFLEVSRSLADCPESREEAVQMTLAAGKRVVDQRSDPEFPSKG